MLFPHLKGGGTPIHQHLPDALRSQQHGTRVQLAVIQYPSHQCQGCNTVLGPSWSGKKRRQQLPSQQGPKDIPALTAGLTAKRNHSKWLSWDLQYRKSVTGWTNCFWTSCSNVLLVSELDHLSLMTLPTLIRGGKSGTSMGRSFPCRQVQQA